MEWCSTGPTPAARGSTPSRSPKRPAQGLASALITALAAEAHWRGCRQLGLEVRADNIAARRLSEKLGFHFANALAGYYEDGTAGLRMTLPLDH